LKNEILEGISKRTTLLPTALETKLEHLARIADVAGGL
jgi:hypothetical protein